MKYLVILFIVMLLMYITTTPDWLYRSGEKKKDDIESYTATLYSGVCINDCDNCPNKPQCDRMLDWCYEMDKHKRKGGSKW